MIKILVHAQTKMGGKLSDYQMCESKCLEMKNGSQAKITAYHRKKEHKSRNNGRPSTTDNPSQGFPKWGVGGVPKIKYMLLSSFTDAGQHSWYKIRSFS